MASTARPKKSPARKVASDFDDPFRAPTAAERRRMDAEQAAPYKEAYEAGHKEGQAKANAKKPAGKKAPAKRPSSSSRRRAPQSLRTASRQLAGPVRTQITGGLQLTGMALGLVALYAILTNAPAFTGVLDGLSRGLRWLAAPDRTIPSRP